MFIKALGFVAGTAGTPTQVTDSDNFAEVHDAAIQADPANTGRVGIGDSTVNLAAKTGLIRILLPGGVFDLSSNAGNDNDMRQYYFDVDTTGEGIIGGGTEK